MRQLLATGTGRQAAFAIEDLQPGSYYLEAWQDTDHNGQITPGDLYGCYGGAGYPGATLPPLTLAEGETRFVRLEMATMPAPPDEGNTPEDQGRNTKGSKGEQSTITEGYEDR